MQTACDIAASSQRLVGGIKARGGGGAAPVCLARCYEHCPLFVLCFVLRVKMTSTKVFVCVLVAVCVSIRQTMAAPAPQEEENQPPMPYEYKYDVEDQEKLLYFGANEAGDAQGKVVGGYKVLLPDGRLMNVEYTVEGDSGFVPKISFEDNASPFGKGN